MNTTPEMIKEAFENVNRNRKLVFSKAMILEQAQRDLDAEKMEHLSKGVEGSNAEIRKANLAKLVTGAANRVANAKEELDQAVFEFEFAKNDLSLVKMLFHYDQLVVNERQSSL